MNGDLGREAESREIKHCLSGTRPEVPPGQCHAHCCTPIRQIPCRPFPPRARRLEKCWKLNNRSCWNYSSTLWPYPRRGSDPKAKEQSKRGTLPQRRAHSRALPHQGIEVPLQTLLSQDTPHPAVTGLALNLPSDLIQSSGVHLHGFCLMLEAWGGRRFFADKRLFQHCTIRRQGKKTLTTQSSVIWAQQRGTFRTKHFWNQISAKSLHISSLSRLLTRSKWKCTIRQ